MSKLGEKLMKAFEGEIGLRRWARSLRANVIEECARAITADGLDKIAAEYYATIIRALKDKT